MLAGSEPGIQSAYLSQFYLNWSVFNFLHLKFVKNCISPKIRSFAKTKSLCCIGPCQPMEVGAALQAGKTLLSPLQTTCICCPWNGCLHQAQIQRVQSAPRRPSLLSGIQQNLLGIPDTSDQPRLRATPTEWCHIEYGIWRNFSQKLDSVVLSLIFKAAIQE